MQPTDDTTDRTAPRRRHSLRIFAIGAALGTLVALLVGVTTLIVMVRDTTPDLTDEALQAAIRRWKEDGPASYNLDLAVGGARSGTVHLEVRDGQVTAFTRDGQTPERRHTWDAWTVPSQFDTIHREQDLAADPSGEMGVPKGTRLLLKAEFHPRWGYPLRYRRLVLGRGPDVSWDVTRFEPID